MARKRPRDRLSAAGTDGRAVTDGGSREAGDRPTADSKPDVPPENGCTQERADGYRGIWFTLGQIDGDRITGEYGDKYSGGLGTYTSKHVPMAAYAPEVRKTFFTYGGTRRDERDLLIMASYYDHDAHEVPRPTIVDAKPEPDPGYDSETVVDPHDNASLTLDDDGHVWIFVSGRGIVRPGRIYRSVDPYSVASFERIREWGRFSYPQPWLLDGKLVLCFTIYDENWTRELFWRTSPNGRDWSSPSKLVGIDGQYQISAARDGTLVTAFNWHPGGDPDRRTNLYALRTSDGITWETVDGTAIDPPLTEPDNEALVVDYDARDRFVYLNDVTFDPDGNPLVLYVTSDGPEPGPENDPRRWTVAHWNDGAWRTHTVTESDHNYDSGSICASVDGWTVLGPTETGPQPYHTGGEMAVWESADEGVSWKRTRVFPTRGERNATYARRPHGATPPFEAFWADGDASRPGDSRLYFASLDGEYWQLPSDMEEDVAAPLPLVERDR